MNTYFQQAALINWNDEAIATRAEALLKAALLVWPRPADGDVSPVAVASALAGR